MLLKYKVIIGISFMVFLLAQCTSQKQVTYEFPAAMAAPIKSEYMKICDKGKVLYDLNCAGCHNTKVRGREVIPDFTSEQLVGYTLRVLNPQHESGIPEENVTPEELGLISTFLMYKKKNSTK